MRIFYESIRKIIDILYINNPDNDIVRGRG